MEHRPDDDSVARWYVVHTYSGYENKVKHNLEKTIENRGLQDRIVEISIPTEEVAEFKDGKRAGLYSRSCFRAMSWSR